MRTCSTCTYSGILRGAENEIITVCRRNPPRVNSNVAPVGNDRTKAQLYNQTLWPSVTDEDWCGEYKLEVAK